MPSPSIDSEISRALDQVFGDTVARTLTRQRAEHVLRAFAHYVAHNAASDALMSLLTTADAAMHLGVSVRRVRAIARHRKVGWQVSRGTWIFRPEDLDHMRPLRTIVSPRDPDHHR